VAIATVNPSRFYEVLWDDPAELVAASRRYPGLDFLRAIARGKLPAPPICKALDFSFENVEEGSIQAGMRPSEMHYNAIGSVHGGVIATLLDAVMGCAVHTKLDRGRGYTTLEIKVNYVRALTRHTHRVCATGRVVHLGRRTAIADGFLEDNTGRIYARGTTTCLILDLSGA